MFALAVTAGVVTMTALGGFVYFRNIKKNIIRPIELLNHASGELVDNIEKGVVFSREGDRIWKCRNCGHIVIGKNAPKICPVCAHPQSYFEISVENY